MIHEFLAALFDASVPFLRYSVIAGLLASVAFGMVGSIVVVRRISYIAGAISHAALAGLGGSLFAREVYGIAWLTPMTGAVIAALGSGCIIALVSVYGKQREDTVIGTIWAVGMAIGLLFLAKTPGYVDPMSYLFGNILLLRQSDLILIAVLDGLVIILTLLFYNQFLSVSFDEEYARTRGLNTGFYSFLLIILISLTVVLMVSLVGIVMVIALLTIPAAVASLFTRQLWSMMAAATLFCAVFTSGGVFFSYTFNTPAGASTIILAGGVYLLLLIVVRTRRSRRRNTTEQIEKE